MPVKFFFVKIVEAWQLFFISVTILDLVNARVKISTLAEDLVGCVFLPPFKACRRAK